MAILVTTPLSYLSSLLYLTLSVQQAFATTVTFANTQSSEISTFQVFTAGTHSDLCCIPVDINRNDGRGFGWFKPDMVSFSRIETAQTATTVFGHRSQLACVDDIRATKQGKADWQTEVPLAIGGVGSAAVTYIGRPGRLRPKYPDNIVIGDVRYKFAFEDQSGILTYWDDEYNAIGGRPLARLPTHSSQARDDEQRMDSRKRER